MRTGLMFLLTHLVWDATLLISTHAPLTCFLPVTPDGEEAHLNNHVYTQQVSCSNPNYFNTNDVSIQI